MNTLVIPDGVGVVGSRSLSDDPRCSLEDIVQIRFPDGVCIDVGWYPEHSSQGTFRIVVFKGDWENRTGEIDIVGVGATTRYVQALIDNFVE